MAKDTKDIAETGATTAAEVIPSEDSVAAQLKKLGAELMAAADNELASKEKIQQIEGLLGNLQIKDFPQLAESPVVQSILSMLGVDDLRPGEARNRGTLAEREREWTWGDVNAAVRKGEMDLVKFSPGETINITWNGLQLQLPAHKMIEIPRPFFDIYMDHVKALEQAAIHEAYLLGRSDVPPHPDWQTPEMAIVRAMSLQGRPYGKPGGTLATGPIFVGEEESGQNG